MELDVSFANWNFGLQFSQQLRIEYKNMNMTRWNKRKGIKNTKNEIIIEINKCLCYYYFIVSLKRFGGGL